MITREIIKKCLSIDNIIGNLPKGEWEICTDSRSFKPEEIFLALNGEKHKGIKFVEDVIKKGGQIIIVEDDGDLLEEFYQKYPTVVFLLTRDSLQTYQELAAIYIEDWKKLAPNKKVIGITGSNGKTTNKEMLYYFLNFLFPDKIMATYKNFNNHVGVPKTLLDVGPDVDIAIVEMGINHVGEMDPLVKMAKPSAGLITNVGTAHIEHLKSLDVTFKEKAKLFVQTMKVTKNEGYFVIPAEDEYLGTLPHHQNVVFWAEKGHKNEEGADVLYTYTPSQMELFDKRTSSSLILENRNIVGKHNYKNLLATFLLASELFPERKAELVEAAAHFIPSNNRSTWVMKNNCYYFMDAYNANPSSMAESIKGIVEYFKNNNIDQADAFFIIGDMYELGEHTAHFHKEIGSLLQSLGVKSVAFIGRYAHFYKEGFNSDQCFVYEQKSDFVREQWDILQKKYRYFFLKASRGMAFETFIGTAEH